MSLVTSIITITNRTLLVFAQIPPSNPPQRAPLPVIPRPQSPNPTLTPAEIPPQENILPPIDNDNNLVIPINKPLNVDNLLEALQLLKIDPLIQQISATLSSGSTENQSILIVEYKPTNLLAMELNIDNSGSPSVGTFKPSVTLKGNNLLGLGDVVRSSYYYTEGSNEDNDGNSPDITSNSNTYELTFRQPIIQQISEQSYQNLALGLTGSWRENQSFLSE